jgi:hypothetical protein
MEEMQEREGATKDGQMVDTAAPRQIKGDVEAGEGWKIR